MKGGGFGKPSTVANHSSGAHHYMWCATPPSQKEFPVSWGRHTYAHLKYIYRYIKDSTKYLKFPESSESSEILKIPPKIS